MHRKKTVHWELSPWLCELCTGHCSTPCPAPWPWPLARTIASNAQTCILWLEGFHAPPSRVFGLMDRKCQGMMMAPGSSPHSMADGEEVAKLSSDLASPVECIPAVCSTLAPSFPSRTESVTCSCVWLGNIVCWTPAFPAPPPHACLGFLLTWITSLHVKPCPSGKSSQVSVTLSLPFPTLLGITLKTSTLSPKEPANVVPYTAKETLQM